MTELKDMDNGIVITPFVSLKEKQEVIRTLHKTLDGRQLISRFGEPAVSYDITVYVKEDGRQALFSAEDQLFLLKVTLCHYSLLQIPTLVTTILNFMNHYVTVLMMN